MSSLEYNSSIITITMGNNAESLIEEEAAQTGYSCQFFALDVNDPHKARKQLHTIESIMKLPTHPNVPRMISRVIGIHSPTYIALKEVGTTFSTASEKMSQSDRIASMDQLSWALNFFHEHNIAHGNISFENLRMKNAEIQLIGLQNAILNAKESEKEQDLSAFDDICVRLGVPNADQNSLHSVEIVSNDLMSNSVCYVYGDFEVLASKPSCDTETTSCNISRGIFSTVSIKDLKTDEIAQLVKLSAHTQFLTIFPEETLISPLTKTLLMDYYTGGISLHSVIHGDEPYGFRTAKRWIEQISQGVIFLGEHNFVHGAICPENLMKFGNRIKIMFLENIFKKTRDTRLYYLDQETLISNEKSTSPSSDEHSLRIVIYEILTRRYPGELWDKRTQGEVILGIGENLTFLFGNINDKLSYLPILVHIRQLARTYRDLQIIKSNTGAFKFPINYFSLILRNTDLIGKNDPQIAPPIRTNLYQNHYDLLPLIEFSSAEKENIYFKDSRGKHIRFASSGPRRINNKATQVDCDCVFPCDCGYCANFTTKCDCQQVFTNRSVEFGEAFKISVTPIENAPKYLRVSANIYCGKTPYFLKIKSAAVIFRLTNELVCVYSKEEDGGYYCQRLWMELNLPLRIEVRNGIKSVTIRHATEQETMEATKISSVPVKKSNILRHTEPYRMASNSLQPEMDFIVIPESAIKKNDKVVFRLNITGTELTTDELVFESIEYNGSRYTFVRDDTFNDIRLCSVMYDYVPFSAFALLCDYNTSKLDPYGHSIVNYRGFVCNDHGVTGFVMDNITGTLWDEVIMNNSMKIELKQVYLWMKQITIALELLLSEHSNKYTLNSKFIFMTEDGATKCFYVPLMNLNRMYQTIPRRRSRYEPVDIPDIDDDDQCYNDVAIYTLGTILWDLLHREDVPFTIPEHMQPYQNYDIDESVGTDELRELIGRCWSAHREIRPTLKEITFFATKKLTELEIPFLPESDLKISDTFKLTQFSDGRDSHIQHVYISNMNLSSVIYKRFIKMKDEYKRREVETFRLALGNPHFTICHAIVGSYENIEGLILEKMLGDVWKNIIDNKNLGYGPCEITRWSWQIASAIMFLHSQNIVHRDIKPENMLVDKNFNSVKLTDFGIITSSEKTTDFNCTLKYCAPEAFHWERERYNRKIDIYAFGVSLYELIERREFVYSAEDNVTIQAELDEAHISFAIERCCSHNPYERPSSEELAKYFEKQKYLFKGKPTLRILQE